jgi:23S rRNA (guanosine2251-2'-O)-methyltransferase
LGALPGESPKKGACLGAVVTVHRTLDTCCDTEMASKKTEIKRFMRTFERPALDLVLVLQDVEDPVNVGSIFRVADALKASELVLTGISARPPHRLISKVGRGKDERVRWRYVESIEDALREVRNGGHRIYAVEITPEAKAYDLATYAEKTCLLVGHEDHGVTKKALALAHETVFIPMYGKGASLNVHVALSVVAFHVAHDRRVTSDPSCPPRAASS